MASLMPFENQVSEALEDTAERILMGTDFSPQRIAENNRAWWHRLFATKTTRADRLQAISCRSSTVASEDSAILLF